MGFLKIYCILVGPFSPMILSWPGKFNGLSVSSENEVFVALTHHQKSIRTIPPQEQSRLPTIESKQFMLLLVLRVSSVLLLDPPSLIRQGERIPPQIKIKKLREEENEKKAKPYYYTIIRITARVHIQIQTLYLKQPSLAKLQRFIRLFFFFFCRYNPPENDL